MADFVNPATQEMNIIREIGDTVSRTGNPIGQFSGGDGFSVQLIEELKERGVVKFTKVIKAFEGTAFLGLNLTLDGWKRYESEKRGGFDRKYGFLAMEFGDTVLDALANKVMKPILKEAIGYDLVDMRDVAQAGIIDNIMRAQIRDSAFVIADLTHDNSGAYWEAGYAEGLGKPVIYICERTKFEKEKSHFDTNHCTTVFWTKNELNKFIPELIAALRRSLDNAQ